MGNTACFKEGGIVICTISLSLSSSHSTIRHLCSHSLPHTHTTLRLEINQKRKKQEEINKHPIKRPTISHVVLASHVSTQSNELNAHSSLSTSHNSTSYLQNDRPTSSQGDSNHQEQPPQTNPQTLYRRKLHITVLVLICEIYFMIKVVMLRVS